ncbi:unnamed protein product, partial [Rotaria socialis]
MDPFIIRGTSSTITQRRAQPVSQQSHSNSMSRRSFSTASPSKEGKDMIGTLSTQKQSLKLSSKKS